MPADQLLDDGLEQLLALHRAQPGAFSAATLSPQEATADGRIRSNVSHECAHIVLDHDVRSVQKLGDHHFFTCDPEQEEEANWLAAAILLPRPLLLDAARRDLTDKEIAETHRVSTEMARFRLNATGVKMPVARGRGRQS